MLTGKDAFRPALSPARSLMKPSRWLALAVFGLVPGLWAAAADWPQFRGPAGLGVAPKAEPGLPTQWDEQTNLAWKVELPGPGASSPIVVGDRVLVTCYSGYGVPKQAGDIADLRRHLLCFDRGGKPLWKKEIKADAEDAPYGGSYLPLHGYASSTPAADGKAVYAFFGVAGVIAYDLDGKELWRRSVGTGTDGWGSGSSPVLYKDLVLVNASIESASVIALRRTDGTPAWKVKGMGKCWSSPALVAVGGRQELVINFPGKVEAFDPDNGNPLWHCEGIPDFYSCPTAVSHDGVAFVIGARQQTALAIKAGGKGDISASHVLWRINKGSNVGSPLYLDGRLYWSHEQSGIAYCVDAKSGALVYAERLQPDPGLIYASATYGDGKIYYVSRQEGVYVLAAGPKFKLLAHNRFKSDNSVFNGSPAIADGQLFLRSDRYLYCIGKAKR
jgi:outer membrane protein assembly factor BamB